MGGRVGDGFGERFLVLVDGLLDTRSNFLDGWVGLSKFLVDRLFQVMLRDGFIKERE